MIRNNNFAAEMIPIRLIISIVIISSILLMIGVGFRNYNITSAENHIQLECEALKSKLVTMIESGISRDVDEINSCDGTKRRFTFSLPDNLIYLSFGVDPDINDDGILETGLTANGSVIFYKISGGSKHVYWFEGKYKFREGKYVDDKWIINNDGEGYIIESGGIIMLNFEFVQKNQKTYILIHATDTIDQ